MSPSIPTDIRMVVFAASATCPYCECPRDFDFTHACYDAYTCWNPICDMNIAEMAATSPDAHEEPLNPDSWPRHNTMPSLGFTATAATATAASISATAATAAFTSATAATAAFTAATAAAAPASATAAKRDKKIARKAGPRHTSKKGVVRNKTTAANKAAAGASRKEEAAEEAVPGLKTVSWADAPLAPLAPPAPPAPLAPLAPPARKMARVDAPKPAPNLPMMPTTLPPWEAPRVAPVERIPYERELYWPVGKISICKNKDDVCKMSGLGPQGRVWANVTAFTRFVDQGGMLPPTLSMPGMPEYTVRQWTDVLDRMLVEYQRTGE